MSLHRSNIPVSLAEAMVDPSSALVNASSEAFCESGILSTLNAETVITYGCGPEPFGGSGHP